MIRGAKTIRLEMQKVIETPKRKESQPERKSSFQTVESF